MPDGAITPGERVTARDNLLRRLIDVVALPASRAGVQDRAIAGDLLLELLLDADEASRQICAARLAEMTEAPRRVLRFLASDVPAVSRPILEDSKALDESDLSSVVRTGGADHRMAIAGRRHIGPCVSDAIADSGDLAAMQRLLENPESTISDRAMDKFVSESRDAQGLVRRLLLRDEIRPAHALVMFWWADAPTRREILMRFSAERQTLIESCADIFTQAADESWADEMVRKGLQVIERRQRNRLALDKSPFASLEDAVSAALEAGLDRTMAQEISYLSGIKPLTGAKILTDRGGEGVAVLCKATGLKRPYFRALWSALGRGVSEEGASDSEYERVLDVYEMLAVAKAQTVLRYWNWSLSAAFSPDVLQGSEDAAGFDEDAHASPSLRATSLIFGRSRST